jgi:hypothetical protein
MQQNVADFRQLPKAEWYKVNQDYFVMNGERCYGVVRLAVESYLASIVGAPKGSVGGDLGRFFSIEEAKADIEQWLLDHRQIGIEAVATDAGVVTRLAPLKPIFINPLQCPVSPAESP